ncbi:transposase, MuDR, MULE transposase domain protein, partial [Tanacetum coccineum]
MRFKLYVVAAKKVDLRDVGIVAIIKSCTPYALGDLTVTLKELFGTISGTIHYKVLTEERFANTITIGASLILHNVLIM